MVCCMHGKLAVLARELCNEETAENRSPPLALSSLIQMLCSVQEPLYVVSKIYIAEAAFVLWFQMLYYVHTNPIVVNTNTTLHIHIWSLVFNVIHSFYKHFILVVFIFWWCMSTCLYG